MKKFIGEFKEFIMRGNVIDMAVGVVVGTAFSAIVNSLVKDIIMPIVSILTGRIDFTNLFFALDGNSYGSLAEATAKTSVIAYGSFLQAIVQFLIIAFSIFVTIKFLNKLRRKKVEEEEEVPTTKQCQFCKTEIAIDAVKCPNCTSDLQ